jgi:hypothetical protein
MSFDPMAAAVDWLDAYRAGDIEAILDMYAEDAEVYCGCGSIKTFSGRDALRVYWIDRLRNYPASDLDNLLPSSDGTVISYATGIGTVMAVLAFTAAGKIKTLTCGPSN